MNPFPERQLAVLRELHSIWNADRFIIIGAAAIARHLDFRWRETIDLDLCVSATVVACFRDLERLGWRRDPKASQRWLSANDAPVDVLPGDPDLLRQGHFTWPDGSARLNLAGFRLAFSDASPVGIAPGVKVRVASLRSLVVLKMAAYLDRPWERDSDLEDMAYILSEFLPPDAEDRWTPEVIDLGINYEDAAPFVLGKQLGGLVDRAERALVLSFLAAIEDPDDRLATLNRMARRAPTVLKDPDLLRRSFAAFRRGLESQIRR